MKSKIFALYLPQYHETPENDEWWGKGYTDWVAVKTAKPNYIGHNQPRLPLNNNYYDLLDVNNIRWQANLAKKYGIDGFCIYHYYSAGKLQMYRPAELLLNAKDIDIEYYFSWANHDFAKQWFGGDGHLLRKQEYGDKETWIEHYRYLSKFFKDDRYLKIEKKPVFAIYNVFHIKCFNEMMYVWEQLAKKDGFDGLYIIGTKSNTNLKSVELLENQWIKKSFIFEPMNYRSNGINTSVMYATRRRIKTVLIRANNKIRPNHSIQEKYSIKAAYEAILNRKMDKNEIYGFFVDWDNTPRYRSKSVTFIGASVVLFEKYFEKIYSKSCRENKEIIVINAWNEWGESSYLEPDKLNGYGYLEAIKSVVDET
ncbi:glycosyltransferase WbsX family protein [Lapidilactobacillus luobeiensis]|uniref:glycosyltransferase WbsX family protein n=1 Tax=Lapidilactobacillus luobeiensis TaxID=2950371 RepID=UPI0021C273D3|nr:glycoside hydrolase family 99-like domain-containing protein [Lapidilactobacillus luobeiensis]